MNDEDKVRAYMLKERDRTINECDGDVKDAMQYLIMDANTDCEVDLPYETLVKIATEVCNA